MRYTIIMLAGILVGARLLPQKYLHVNGKLQICITVLLLFTMGVSFGAQPGFFADLRAAGLKSLVYAAGGVLGSALAVWALAKLFLGGKEP